MYLKEAYMRTAIMFQDCYSGAGCRSEIQLDARFLSHAQQIALPVDSNRVLTEREAAFNARVGAVSRHGVERLVGPLRIVQTAVLVNARHRTARTRLDQFDHDFPARLAKCDGVDIIFFVGLEAGQDQVRAEA